MKKILVLKIVFMLVYMPLAAQQSIVAFNQSQEKEPETLEQLNKLLEQKAYESDPFYGQRGYTSVPYDQIKKYEGIGYIPGIDNEKRYQDWKYKAILRYIIYLVLGTFFVGIIYLGFKGNGKLKKVIKEENDSR